MRVVFGRATDSWMKLDDISQLVGIMNFVFSNKKTNEWTNQCFASDGTRSIN